MKAFWNIQALRILPGVCIKPLSVSAFSRSSLFLRHSWAAALVSVLAGFLHQLVNKRSKLGSWNSTSLCSSLSLSILSPRNPPFGLKTKHLFCLLGASSSLQILEERVNFSSAGWSSSWKVSSVSPLNAFYTSLFLRNFSMIAPLLVHFLPLDFKISLSPSDSDGVPGGGRLVINRPYHRSGISAQMRQPRRWSRKEEMRRGSCKKLIQ